MEYFFLKDNITNGENTPKIQYSDFEEYLLANENKFILKHNSKAIEKILTFLNTGNSNIFILNGFMGAGKTAVTDFISNFINEDVIVFKNSYQEAINTDDILLSMFKVFYDCNNAQKINLPKVSTNVFSEKINAYIKSCTIPMFFIFDSFEINMRNKETQNDILDFINYLSRFEKVKILICSRTFRKEDLIQNIGVESYSLTPIEKEEFIDYLISFDITGSNYELEDFYKVSRGHYLLLELSVLIMQILSIPLTSFVNEYKKSTKNFLEFLLSKILGTTSDKFIKQLLFLSLIRHGVSGEFLVFQNIATVDDIDFLIQKHVIAEKYGKFYIKDYFKNSFVKTINEESRIKAHSYIIDIYEEELPLKPFDRALFLSRQTMRQEIAYHKEKIEKLKENLIKEGKIKRAEQQDFTYVSYSKTSGFDSDKSQNERKSINQIKRNARKQRKSNISDNDSRLLNISGNEDVLTKNFQNITYNNNIDEKNNTDDIFIDITPIDTIPDSLEEYVNIADDYIEEYNYTNAILYLKKALTYTNNKDYDIKENEIYSKIAFCHRKMQDVDEAAKFYNKVFNNYKQRNEINSAVKTLIDMAKMYTEAYRIDSARQIYQKILSSTETIPKEIIISVYFYLAEIEDNNINQKMALEYLQNAIKLAQNVSDKGILAKAYYKYALIFDDLDNIEYAEKFYLRCIQVSNNPDENKYISAAYANLGDIAFDSNNNSAAKMYYELSVEADKRTDNIDGMYYSYMKLAEIYLSEDLEKHYTSLKNALNVAKKFEDTDNIVNVYIAIGNYYELKRDYKQAIKSYIIAKSLTTDETLRNTINIKFGKIKSNIGEIAFNTYIDEINKKK